MGRDMAGDIHFRINQGPFIPCSKSPVPYRVTEDDLLTLRVIQQDDTDLPNIFLGDYRIQLKDEAIAVDGGMAWETEPRNYFKESFGYAFVRIEYADEELSLPFDVLIRKANSQRAHEMLDYIAGQNFNILKTCFSRSTTGVDMLPDNRTEPEALVSQAEKILEYFQVHRTELFRNLRERLIPALTPVWDVSEANIEIDPYNVISNLNSLTPAAGGGEVFIRGRYFDFNGSDISSLQPSSDVFENQVILGGFYSIRRRILALYQELAQVDVDEGNTPYGYESFSRLMLELTAEGMMNRCARIVRGCDQSIRLLERKARIDFAGELKPVMTAFVRGSKVYRGIFTQLSRWYQLGVPFIEGIHFLMKLRSLSRLYEIFTIIKLIEYFVMREWTIAEALAHDELGEAVPSYLKLTRGNTTLSLYYEMRIFPFDEDTTRHMDLVDIWHKPKRQYAYWEPDFVLRMEVGSNIRYLILDAKYSSSYTVKKWSLPDIYEKYFEKTAVYDQKAGLLISSPILCVMAIHATPGNSSGYFSHWPSRGIYSALPRIPIVGGVALTTDENHRFNAVMDALLSIIERVR